MLLKVFFLSLQKRLNMNKTKAQLINRCPRVKTVRDKKEDVSEISELYNVCFFQEKHPKLGSPFLLIWKVIAQTTSMKKLYNNRSTKLAWNICMKLNLLNVLQIGKSRVLWDISNNFWFGFILKYAETGVSRKYLLLLGTGCEKGFFRLNIQTKVKQNFLDYLTIEQN